MRIQELNGIPNQGMGRAPSPFDQFAFDSSLDSESRTRIDINKQSAYLADVDAPTGLKLATKGISKPQPAVVLTKQEVIKLANTTPTKTTAPISVAAPVQQTKTPAPLPKTTIPVQTMAPITITKSSVQPNTQPNNPEQPEANDKPNKTLLYGGIALAVVVVGAIALSGGESKPKAKPMGKVPAKKKPAKRTRKPVAKKPTAKKNPSGRKTVAKVTFS